MQKYDVDKMLKDFDKLSTEKKSALFKGLCDKSLNEVEITNVNVFVFETRYTDRLDDKVSEILDDIEKNNKYGFNDEEDNFSLCMDLCDPSADIRWGTFSVPKKIRKIPLERGSVLFYMKDLSFMRFGLYHKLFEALVKTNFCACLHECFLYKMRQRVVKGLIVLYLTVDTESG